MKVVQTNTSTLALRIGTVRSNQLRGGGTLACDYGVASGYRFPRHMMMGTAQRIAGGLLQPLRTAARVRAVRADVKTVRPLNVILGAGPVAMSGWVSTDSEVLDVTSSRAWKRLFASTC